MRIIEILLPREMRDRSISPQHIRQIDALQKRMDGYVDKILNPKTSLQGKEFLKSRLRDDYYELRDTIGRVHRVAEDELPATVSTQQYEIYDIKTGKTVGKPYISRSKARTRADRLDNEYGAYRYKVRPIGSTLTEAVHKLPLTNEDFELVQELMLRPIPAAIAPIYIQDIIIDDEFTDQINSIEESDPGRDIRPLIVEWFRRVMPDQMYRFTGEAQTMKQKMGILSPVHGYDPHMYHGSNEPITGDAYGRR
jgi:hypothetical protein